MTSIIERVRNRPKSESLVDQDDENWELKLGERLAVLGKTKSVELDDYVQTLYVLSKPSHEATADDCIDLGCSLPTLGAEYLRSGRMNLDEAMLLVYYALDCLEQVAPDVWTHEYPEILVEIEADLGEAIRSMSSSASERKLTALEKKRYRTFAQIRSELSSTSSTNTVTYVRGAP